MPRGSVYAAPVGTKPGDEGWKLIGHTSEDGITMTEPFMLNADRAQLRFDEGHSWPRSATIPSGGWKPAGFANETPAWLRTQHDYSMPSRWLLGVPPPGGYEIKTASQEALDLYFGKTTTNERSKPVGLTKQHTYRDSDGDALTVDESSDAGSSVYITASDSGVQVGFADSIPLALNVLGYDRPSSGLHQDDATKYNGHSANTAIPSSPERRDANVALAIDYLRGADIYDQRVAERKAANDEWQKKVAAEAKAREEAAKERAADRAKEAYVSAIIEQHQSGVTAESVAKVQAALSAYETARRKAEGLPN